MKKNTVLLGMMVLLIGLVITVIGCESDAGNPFIGTWTKDGSGGTVTVIVTETQWVSNYNNTLYNSGLYSYSGVTADWAVTNKGIGTAEIGDTGVAAILNNGKMQLSSFPDPNMDGLYSK